jgi:tetratricopeptide (TPR) repeat protein
VILRRSRVSLAGIAVVLAIACLCSETAFAQHHHHSHYSGSSGLAVGSGSLLNRNYGSNPPLFPSYYLPSVGYFSNYGLINSPAIGYPFPLVPGGAMYGPQAAGNLLGPMNMGFPLGQNGPLAPSPLAQGPAANLGGGFGVLAPGAGPAPANPRVARTSNGQSMAKAEHMLVIGDEHFRKQKYHDAYQRYKDAATLAPDAADAFFREGLSLLALGKYEQSAKAFKRGLMFQPDWPKSNFRIAKLYGDNLLAKTAHREALAQAATDDPDDPNLLFLLGIDLYFDGQAQRSQPFFARAKALEMGEGHHLRLFLDELARTPVNPPLQPAPPQEREI